MKSILIQIGIALAVFIAALDTSITNTLLPVLTDVFKISNDLSISSVFIYQLIMAAFTIPLLNYGRIKGLNQIFYVGIIVFINSALICGLAPSFFIFVLGRIGQAFGATAILGSYNAILKQIVPKEKLGKWIGITAFTIASGLSLGPSMVSFLLQFIDWNWIFLVNIPIGIVALFLLRNKLPKTTRTESHFNWKLNGILVVAFSLVLIGLNLIKNQLYFAISSLIIASVLLSFIYKNSKKQNIPVFPFQFINQARFIYPLLATVFVFTIQSIAYIGLPIILYKQFAVSTVKMGYLISPWPLMGALFAPLAGYLSDRLHSIKLSLIGLLLLGIGIIMITFSFPNNENVYLAYAMLVCGVGFGFFQAPNIKSIMTQADEKESGNASGLLAVFRVFGQTLGSIIVAYFMLNFEIVDWQLLYYFAALLAFIGCVFLLLSINQNKSLSN